MVRIQNLDVCMTLVSDGARIKTLQPSPPRLRSVVGKSKCFAFCFECINIRTVDISLAVKTTNCLLEPDTTSENGLDMRVDVRNGQRNGLQEGSNGVEIAKMVDGACTLCL